MALPGDLTTRTLTGTYLAGDGTPLVGWVDLVPTGVLLDAASAVLPAAVVRRQLTAAGTFSVALPVTDDADLVESEGATWYWQITEHVEGGRTFTFTLPAGTGSLDIADVDVQD